jgi:hypothetical protein
MFSTCRNVLKKDSPITSSFANLEKYYVHCAVITRAENVIYYLQDLNGIKNGSKIFPTAHPVLRIRIRDPALFCP